MPFGEQRAAAQAAQGRAEGRRQLLALPPNERHKRLLDDYGAWSVARWPHTRAARSLTHTR